MAKITLLEASRLADNPPDGVSEMGWVCACFAAYEACVKASTPKFVERHSLASRGAFCDEADQDLHQPILVGSDPVATWRTNEWIYGYDVSTLYPALQNGERIWMQELDWRPSGNNVADGRCELLLSFDEGISLLSSQKIVLSESQLDDLFSV